MGDNYKEKMEDTTIDDILDDMVYDDVRTVEEEFIIHANKKETEK